MSSKEKPSRSGCSSTKPNSPTKASSEQREPSTPSKSQLDPTNESDMQLPKKEFILPKQNDGFQIPYFLSSEEEVSKIRPPASIQTWEQRYETLDEKKKASFAAFTQKVQEALWYEEGKFDNWLRLRYLTARSFDVNKAYAMLENTVNWWKETGSPEWKCDACLQDPNQHMGQFIGWDLEHRPVMFMSMRWGPERKNPLRHMVCCFNHMISLMPEGVEKWVCVTDFESYSHFRDGKPSMGLGVIRTIQDHFPERLGKMVCVNPPTMFWVLWKLFYPVIDPVTRTKVEFVYTEDKPSAYEIFPKLFPESLCQYFYDTYNRSKHSLPAEPLVWRPDPDGYPTTYEERKEQLHSAKSKSRQNEKDAKKAAHDARRAEREAEKEKKKKGHGDVADNTADASATGPTEERRSSVPSATV